MHRPSWPTDFIRLSPLCLAFTPNPIFFRWKEAIETESILEVQIHNLALQIARKFKGGERSRLSCSPVADAKQGLHESDDSHGGTSKDSPPRNAVIIRMQLIRWLHLSHAIVIGDVCQMRTNEFSSLEKIRDFGL